MVNWVFVFSSAIGTLVAFGGLSIFVFLLGAVVKWYQLKKINNLMKGK